jgi:hypothetical protein
MTRIPIRPPPHFFFQISILRRSYVIYLCTYLQYLLYFLLAAAAVQCTRSGDKSGEGFALNNFLYTRAGPRSSTPEHCSSTPKRTPRRPKVHLDPTESPGIYWERSDAQRYRTSCTVRYDAGRCMRVVALGARRTASLSDSPMQRTFFMNGMFVTSEPTAAAHILGSLWCD